MVFSEFRECDSSRTCSCSSASAVQEKFQSMFDYAAEVKLCVQRRNIRFKRQTCDGVFLEIASHLGRVCYDGNAVLAQIVGWTYSRKQEDFRGRDAAGGKNNLAFSARHHHLPFAAILHPDRSAIFCHDARYGGIGVNRQVGTSANRKKIGPSGALTQSMLLQNLLVTYTFLAGPIEIGVVGNASLLGCVNKYIGKWMI
ncbi:hypothetical protein EB73_33220 [Mycobacterium sp. SWH-M3]|nr:hypothetical protein EB73_33220 [Mycobacterium sp. SWH-M3]